MAGRGRGGGASREGLDVRDAPRWGGRGKIETPDDCGFDAIVNAIADIECGSTTASLSRMKIVDFSSAVFADSTGVLVKSGKDLFTFDNMVGKNIGVVAGTTNARAVRDQLARRNLSATLVEFRDRREGIAALARGDLDGSVA